MIRIKKAVISICLSAIMLLTSTMSVFAETSELSFEQFFGRLQEEYERYDIEIEVTELDPSYVYTKELLDTELTKVPEIAAGFINSDLEFNVVTQEKVSSHTSQGARVMPINRTYFLYGTATNVALAGAFANVRLSVYTTLDAGISRFISVNGHVSELYSWQVNCEDYYETGFNYSYSNGYKTLNLSWSGHLTFGTDLAGQHVQYHTTKTWSGSVEA